MDKEILTMVGIVVGFFAITFVVFGWHENTVGRECMADCVLNGGEYVRSQARNYANDTCICKMDGKIQNIW